MPVKIHNKDYWPVVERIEKLYTDHPDASITTELVADDGEKVIMKATVTIDGRACTGYAEEARGGSGPFSGSMLEVCETSAVGRCLSFAGYAGTEIASADEVAQAISQQDLTAALIRGIEHGKAIVRLSDTIQAIKDGIAEGNLSVANEAWTELTDDEKKLIWVAPTKGGPFTTEERNVMKSSEFREA